MEEEALVWFQDIEENGVLTSWDAFLGALLVRFGNTSYDDPMEALTRLSRPPQWRNTRPTLSLFQIVLGDYRMIIG